MPDVHIGTLFRGNTVNTLNHLEQAVNRFVFREVGAQLFIADAVKMLLLFFAVVSDIPRLQFIHAEFGFGEGAQLGQLFLTLRTGAFRQVGQEVEHLLRIFGHFGRQRLVGKAVKAQQLRQLVAQGEDFGHYRAVVPFSGVRPLVGGAGGIGAIQLFTQRLIVAVGHYRQIARDIQGQQKPFLLFGFSLGFRCGKRAFRHAGELRFIGDQLGPAHGRVEHVVAVLIAQLGEAGGDFAVAFLLLFRQANTGEFKIAQRVIHRFFLRGIQGGVMVAVAQVAVRFVQAFMLPNPGAVLRKQRQGLLVGFAQFRTVFDRVQMADRGKNTPQHVVYFRQRLAKIFPGIRRPLRHRALYRRPAIIQRFSDRGDHVLGFDGREWR